MAVETAEQELAAVNSAIEQILTGGQEAQIGSARLVQARLEALYARKDKLTERIKRAARGGIRIVGATPV